MSEQFVRNMMDGCGRLKAFRMLAFLTRVLASLSGIYRDHEDWVNCSLLGKYGGIEVQVNWLKRKWDIKTKQTTELPVWDAFSLGTCRMLIDLNFGVEFQTSFLNTGG